MYKLAIILFLTLNFLSYPQSAKEVFEKVNSVQRDYENMSFDATMNIVSGKRRLIKTFFGYLDDNDNSAFIEYTNPQDRGTRYLKLESDMWIYLPDANDVLKLSGHLLRDSMMGSDISYEDMMNQGSYEHDYRANNITSTNFNDKEVYILTIVEKDDKNALYVKQDLFIDKESYNIEKIIAYAKGRNNDSRAIKEFIMKDYKKISRFNMPTTIEVYDLRKKASYTTVTYDKIEVDVYINPQIFTRVYLER